MPSEDIKMTTINKKEMIQIYQNSNRNYFTLTANREGVTRNHLETCFEKITGIPYKKVRELRETHGQCEKDKNNKMTRLSELNEELQRLSENILVLDAAIKTSTGKKEELERQNRLYSAALQANESEEYSNNLQTNKCSLIELEALIKEQQNMLLQYQKEKDTLESEKEQLNSCIREFDEKISLYNKQLELIKGMEQEISNVLHKVFAKASGIEDKLGYLFSSAAFLGVFTVFILSMSLAFTFLAPAEIIAGFMSFAVGLSVPVLGGALAFMLAVVSFRGPGREHQEFSGGGEGLAYLALLGAGLLIIGGIAAGVTVYPLFISVALGLAIGATAFSGVLALVSIGLYISYVVMGTEAYFEKEYQKAENNLLKEKEALCSTEDFKRLVSEFSVKSINQENEAYTEQAVQNNYGSGFPFFQGIVEKNYVDPGTDETLAPGVNF